MKQQQLAGNPNLNALKDLIVNNPRAKDRISIKEIEKEIKESEKREGKSVSGLWEL